MSLDTTTFTIHSFKLSSNAVANLNLRSLDSYGINIEGLAVDGLNPMSPMVSRFTVSPLFLMPLISLWF
jgi:hypothetical protein